MKRRGTLLPAAAVMVALLCALPVRAADAILPDGTQITLQLNDTLGTASNVEGDGFTAVVATPVYLNDQIAIPKGSLVTGSVSRVLRPGRLKGRAVLDLMFQTIRIPGRKDADLDATLIWIDPEGGDGAPQDGVRPEAGGASGGAGKSGQGAGSTKLPKVSPRALAPGGKNIGLASGSRPSVFNSQGEDLVIHRGTVMDILLDLPLTIPDEE
ncbi:MAG: hypothetical protein LBT74_14015 [Acidobacteriota bacterium]|nr:hypothetical protein [Acidobacteriota bacterium]